MGREVRRVPLDFDWPVNKTWHGFLNPHHYGEKCATCDGTGYSPFAKHLMDRWYGYTEFHPRDRGSVPFEPSDGVIRERAERSVSHSPAFYGTGEAAIQREARRLCGLFNKQWSHHLNTDDVRALVDAGRLMDFTHTWSKETGWQPKELPYVPTPREVGEWSISTMGHDSINNWACIKAECERCGEELTCLACGGEGEIWPSQTQKKLYDEWQEVPPPAGDGYQIWETVSEGSPISPVFATPEELAKHMEGTRWGADDGTPYETWLAFIRGPGWAPSMIMADGKLVSGVEAVTR